MSKEKRRFGDRRDGRLIRQQDGMHLIMPMIYPNRCDNEAFISERIDLTSIDKYLASKNADNPEFKYTLFHLIVAAILKTIILRPKLNRFIANKNNYQRNTYSASFVVKKQFDDTSEEGLAFVYATEDSTIDSLHEELRRQIYREKKSNGAGNSTNSTMDILNKLPRWFVKFFIWLMRQLDRHGIVPRLLIEADPYYASVILSNLGSIKRDFKGCCTLLEIIPPQVIAIAINATQQKPIVVDGELKVGTVMPISICMDHRALDYGDVVPFFNKLDEIFANPQIIQEWK